MDSLTQIALGACVAAACVPASQRRKALAVGAMLGTLPDLDVAIDYGDAVANFTQHRGFSHSLLVLVPLAVAIWWAMRRWWRPVGECPGRWFAAVMLTLTTHVLLDAHTAYGTQLWWPVASPPIAWATVFIIDPLYTSPLLVAALVVLWRPRIPASGWCLAAALAVSTAYLGWSWIAQGIVLRNARASLADRGLADAPIFATPTPFNTLLWRVVVLDGAGHLEGFDSLVAEDGPIEFEPRPGDPAAFERSRGIPAAIRLDWFADGFVRADVEGDLLVLTDLRMGQDPDHVFRHAVAGRGNPHWHEIEPQRLPTAMNLDRLRGVWSRIWSAPR